MGSAAMMRALNAYLDSVRDRPFAWGDHDCLTFTNTCFHKLHGEGWADDWLGAYMKDGNTLSWCCGKKVRGVCLLGLFACLLENIQGIYPGR
ncbi:hypothetical protein ROLI_040320 [Roseobacter fucihabitans]|uniref:DUF6950 domain-containing protein n=1 Tax=Roseobacter fucihabitans TaxID=1537242 RepID=A0ABZ2BXX6_9RHOB